jgi:hypothetical protein
VSQSTVSQKPTTDRPAFDRFAAEAIDEDLVRADAARRLDLHLLEMAAARAIIRQLQAELSVWQPLIDLHTEIMARRVSDPKRPAQVVPLAEWVRFDVVGPMRGRTLRGEDPGAVADAMQAGQDG